GLKYLRGIPPTGTYVVGLQTMVFAEAREPQDKVRIEQNAKWLVEAASRQNGRFIGWSYGMAFKGGSDNSNTQYALLGLHAAKQAGIKIDDKTWEEIRDYYRASQSKTAGSWGYTPFDQSARLTMTMAGLCGLYIAGAELTHGKQGLNQQTCVAARCGKYEE